MVYSSFSFFLVLRMSDSFHGALPSELNSVMDLGRIGGFQFVQVFLFGGYLTRNRESGIFHSSKFTINIQDLLLLLKIINHIE